MDTSLNGVDAIAEPIDWHKAEAAACEAENELLRCEILQVEDQLERLPQEPDETSDALKRVAALELELAAVEASLHVLCSTRPAAPTSELRTNEQARLEVVNTVEELEKATLWETERKEDEEAALERDRVLFSDATALYASLAARASTAADSFSPRAAGDALVLRTQGFVHHLSRRTEALQRALVEFVDHLALRVPARGRGTALKEVERGGDEREGGREGDEGAEEHERVRAGLGEGGRATKRRRLSKVLLSSSSSAFHLGEWIRADPALSILGDTAGDSVDEKDGAVPGVVEPDKEAETRAFQVKKLLEVLLNRSVLLPSDPWLDTSPSSSPAPAVAPSPDDGTGSYPPELVAFLVRAGIVVQHPVERHKVRLEDFVGLAGGGS